MSKQVTIGLVVPFAEDKVPPEGHQMYPGMAFLPRGVGVRSLTPEGFTAAFDAIPAAADHLVRKGVDAIIAGEPIERLLDLLKMPEDRIRYRAKIELGARDSGQVVAATKKWIHNLDTKDADFEHQLLEGLWVHQYHNTFDLDLLSRLLQASDFRARAAATRVLCYWRLCLRCGG